MNHIDNIEAISLLDASKQVLEALEDAQVTYGAYWTGYITALRTAIHATVLREQAEEQKPSGHFLDFAAADTVAQVHVYDTFTKGQHFYTTPAAAQRQWVGLADADKDTTSFAYSGRSGDYIRGYEAGMEEAEDKLREKNNL